VNTQPFQRLRQRNQIRKSVVFGEASSTVLMTLFTLKPVITVHSFDDATHGVGLSRRWLTNLV